MVFYLLFMLARLVWRANEKPEARMDEENRAASEARSSRLVVLRRGDGSGQEHVLIVRDSQRGTSGAAAGPDGTDWSEVSRNLTISQILVCGMIVALGIASTALGFYAEAYRSETVFYIDGKCVYPFDVESSYSAAAAAVLVAAQIIVNILACFAPSNPLMGFPNLVIRVLFTSWITFFSAMYSFMIGDVMKQNPYFNGGNRKCFVVNPMVYARGSVFVIITMFCHVTAYLAVCANSSHAKANYTRITQANNDPEAPLLRLSSTAPVVRLSATAILQQREDVWTKLQVLKDEYLEDMKKLYGRLVQKRSMPTISPEQRQRVQHYEDVVDRMISYLMATKERLPSTFNQDTMVDFEKQIVELMEIFRQRRHTPPQPPGLPQQQDPQPNPTEVLLPQQQQLASATDATPTLAIIPAIPPPPPNPTEVLLPQQQQRLASATEATPTPAKIPAIPPPPPNPAA